MTSRYEQVLILRQHWLSRWHYAGGTTDSTDGVNSTGPSDAVPAKLTAAYGFPNTYRVLLVMVCGAESKIPGDLGANDTNASW